VDDISQNKQIDQTSLSSTLTTLSKSNSTTKECLSNFSTYVSWGVNCTCIPWAASRM